MKRLSLILISILLMVSLLVGCGGTKSNKVQIATNAEFYPFEYVDEQTKEIIGFDVDLTNAIAEKAGFEFELVNTGFDALLAGMAECQYDAAISGITITEERAKVMLFSDPYTTAGQTVMVQPDNEIIKAKEDLAGKTVAVQTGTTGAAAVEEISGAIVKYYDSYQLAILDLGNGQVDAVVVDNPVADAFVAKNPGKFKTVGNVFTSEEYGLAICKKNTDLQKKINDAIAALKADGTLKKIEEKWLVPPSQ
jgi:polar amino acid transport system substrate-binding protein